MQGAGAIASIVQALQHCGKYSLDVVILTRGGGSLEDLQAFNSELVARAMFSCTLPIVCGVGHERDWTIADLVADVRAATPSNAAEIVSPDQEQILADVIGLRDTMDDGWRQVLGELYDRLHHLTRDLADVVQGTAQRIQLLGQQLLQSFTFALEHSRVGLANAAKLVSSLSPTATLGRGYSLTLHEGKVVRDAHDVGQGSRLQTRLKRGTIHSTVD